MPVNTDWLDKYAEETAIGPVQRDEALFLFALARVVRPKVVLEFGTFQGHSATAWLQAGVPTVIGVDTKLTVGVQALRAQFGNRFQYYNCSLCDYVMDVPADIVFFDANHRLDDSIKGYHRLTTLPSIIAVHDTGMWAQAHMLPVHHRFPGRKVDGGKLHQPHEILFSQWLQDQGWNRIDFHSINTLRHGISLFQRSAVRLAD